MTKAELVSRLANKTGMKKVDVERVLSAFLDEAKNILKTDGKLTLTGFGTFRVVERAAREGRNPQTGAPIKIPATKVVRFKPGKELKNLF
ncbi:MAG TPA: HU family DNA-binding protein [Candidatus Desulfofervidus auxilii]|uniref:HU family DNA-binding protein n=1 Tax=Desulfofervidus auxilii TaxID=1621989 RepID=A0A7C0Y4D2_DESA2|nr:HU family DNA-binding protein [Candidatus Desulfofervidus auxilii]HDD43548.1 HU family DNA-binding protein [Candidatus Desulfofervidus auxilii]